MLLQSGDHRIPIIQSACQGFWRCLRGASRLMSLSSTLTAAPTRAIQTIRISMTLISSSSMLEHVSPSEIPSGMACLKASGSATGTHHTETRWGGGEVAELLPPQHIFYSLSRIATFSMTRNLLAQVLHEAHATLGSSVALPLPYTMHVSARLTDAARQ
jgi:hypothetical protein